MQRLLIPLFVCLAIGIPSLLIAQIPRSISIPSGPIKYPSEPSHASPDMCNFAGTYSFVNFIGESNDTDLPQIFLCAGDSFLIQHNGDAILNGDPDPSTPPGVAFAWYTCAPTIMGDNLQAIAAIPGPGDPCVLNVPPSMEGLYVTSGTANGGATWFFNSGFINTFFGLGQPTSIFFAPITLDQINPSNPGFESAVVGAPPGPCVNVNTAAAFEVIYLNPIVPEGISLNFGNDCVGKFNIRGGYPEYDGAAIYTISIYLTSDPSVKAIIHNQQIQLFHNAPVLFSVPQPGNYTIVVEDGKSCPATFTMDMGTCNPMENVVLDFPDTTAAPTTNNYCVPLTVENFDVVSGQFSISWDPNVLQYVGISDLSPVLAPTSPSLLNYILNTTNTFQGQLGLVLYDANNIGATLSILDGEPMFNICFNVVGVLGQCTGLNITNNPTGVGFEDGMGLPLALTADTGSVCIQYQPLQVDIAIVDTTCLGTASMVVTATGGAFGAGLNYDVIVEEIVPAGGPTYSGTISGSGSTYTIVGNIGNFNNILNTYSVCVTDSSGIGQTVCDTIDVLIPTLGAQIDFVQQPSCNGLDDGILDAIVLIGGVATPNPGSNYTYTWTPSSLPNPSGSLQDGTIAGGVPSGNYTLIVTDNSRNCSSNPAQGFLGQPSPVSEDIIAITPASCTGVANGVISYTAEGGTPFPGNQYQFVWQDDNGNPFGTPGQNNPIVLNNVPSGTYHVTVTDANGCTDTNSVTVDDQREINLNQGIVVNVSCDGLSDGGVNVTVTETPFAGTQFTFTWSPAGFMQTNNNQSSAYGPVPAGSYFVTAADAVGCSDTLTVVVGSPLPLELSLLGLQNPGCAQQNTGSINVTALGGNGGPNYTYNWEHGATGASQSMLAAGDYSVTVTDIRGCSDSMMFTLQPPQPPPFTVDSMPVRCGSDGSITINAPSAAQYQWVMLPAGTTFGGDTSTVSGLDGGTYAVTIRDGVGCTAVDTITLSSVTPMSFADTSFVQPLCFGDNDGILGITVQDGIAPYVNYQWNPVQPINGPTIFGLTAGVYAVTVTDNVGCTKTGTFTLTQPPQVVNTISNVQDASCAGVCDGTATVLANYATVPVTPGTFTYIWSDGVVNSANRADLCAGTVMVTSADNNGCGATSTVVINEPPVVTGAFTTIPAFCFGSTDGSATILGDGGNGAPYSYLWSNGATTPTANNLAAMQYSVTVTDGQGCTGVVGPITVTEPIEIMVIQDIAQSSDPKCFGAADGNIVVSVSGGNVGTLLYEWSDDMGVIDDTVGELDSIPAGFYSVIVTDAQGCTGSLEDIVLQDPPPVLGTYEDPAPLTCFGDVTTLTIDNIVGGSGGPYSFSVDNGARLSVNFPINLNGGEHTITYYDVNGCSFTDTLPIPEPAKIEVVFDPSTIEIVLGDTTHQLKPLITGAAVETFTWTPSEFLHWPDSLNPYVFAFETKTFTLTVFDDKGCSGSGSITVNVDPNRNVYVPNVFMPGVGRLNDHFNVYLGYGIEIVNFMRIYDRWGELLYTRESFLPNNDNYADGWDGKFNGRYVNPGVYVYMIEVIFKDGRKLLYRGDVTVVR